MSRYLFCIEFMDENRNLALSRRVPFRYKEFADNVVYTALGGESIKDVAQKHYGDFYGYAEARQMYWLICDFQPSPIIDATLTMSPGQNLIIPSPRAIEAYINDPSRAVEFDL